MRKWGIGVWLLVALIAAATGLLGTWYFRDRMQVGWSQLLGVGISGTTLAFFGTVRKETMRWQDNRFRRADKTGEGLDYYNDKIRLLVVAFLMNYDRLVSPLSQLSGNTSGKNKVIVELKVSIARQLGLATILHHADKLAWMLDQKGYVDQSELMYAVGSKLSRLLIDIEYEDVIETMLRASTLHHVQVLIRQLRDNAILEEKEGAVKDEKAK